MEARTVLLEKLKCNKCGKFLSRGPVYLQYDGAALCGRCFAPGFPATRNSYYEAVAQLLRFPCKYRCLGCDDTVPYVQEDEVIAHEEVCEHRDWMMCPMLDPGHCEWLGPRGEIQQHCQARHPDHVVDNPCHLEHDISRSSEATYLVRAFNLYFVLYTKVCAVSAMIYHSVIHLGDADAAARFTFTVNIKRGERFVSLPGEVAPQSCLLIQEAASLALDINSLLNMLGGFDGVSFTVVVKPRESCMGCGAQGASLTHRGWLCERCAPARRSCEHGCTHTDIDKKCRKHEVYFCQQRTQCWVCDASVERGTLNAHRSSACREICRAGDSWRATETSGRSLLLPGAAGTALCLYKLDDLTFVLHIYIPVESERLKEFRCVVHVKQVNTGQVRTFTPDILYDEVHDWYIKVGKAEFPTWSNVFEVCIDIANVQV